MPDDSEIQDDTDRNDGSIQPTNQVIQQESNVYYALLSIVLIANVLLTFVCTLILQTNDELLEILDDSDDDFTLDNECNAAVVTNEAYHPLLRLYTHFFSLCSKLSSEYRIQQ